MMHRVAAPVALVFLASLGAACSDDPADLGDPVDTGIRDLGVVDSGPSDTGAADAAAADTGPVDTGVSDSGAPDQGVTDSGIFDSGLFDSGIADSGPGDATPMDAEFDAGVSCGRLGTACSGVDDCGPNLFCGFAQICVPIPECGGFVMASCPNTSPICLYFSGADIGPCFTQFERNCVCNNPNTASLFSGC